jgi:small-conductance mechanosensitive channel
MKWLQRLPYLALLIVLLLIRLGEINREPLLNWCKPKYQQALNYYINAISSIAIFLLVLSFIRIFVVGLYRRRQHLRGDDNFVIGIGHIYSIVQVIGLAIGILSLFQVEVKELLTSVSIVFAGLALLTKDYISNMINGMILTFSGQISLGDNISIGQHRGKVIVITLQNIHLLNDDDDVIIIPNNLFLTLEVVNYTKRDVKRTSVEFEIDLSFLHSVEEVEQMLIETLQPFAQLIQGDSYYLRVAEVRRESVMLKFQYILKEPNKELERKIRRITVRRIVEFISNREKFVGNIPELPDLPDNPDA